MSAVVTEPKSLPPSPARALTSMRCAASCGTSASAASTVAHLARVAVAAHRLGLRDHTLRRLHRETTRHEVVARVPVGDVDQVTLLAEVLDVVAQHDFHARLLDRVTASNPASGASTSSAITSATATAHPSRRPRRRTRRRCRHDPSVLVGTQAAVEPGARGRNRHLTELAVVAVSALAPATLALGDLAHAVRQQRHLAGDADRPRHLALLLRGVAGDPPGADLGALRHEPAQQVDVLVVDAGDALGVEDRHLLLLRPAAVGRRALAVAASLSCH